MIENYEAILANNQVKVVKEGKIWALVWTHGFISIGPVEDEATARQAAAIFVTLYLGKIRVEFCVERARDFAYIATLERLLESATKTLADYRVTQP